MEKIAVGGGLPDGILDILAAPSENLGRLAEAKKCGVEDLVVLILDRPRHQDLIAAVRATGARIRLIGDGDVAGVIATSREDSGIDIYMGSGARARRRPRRGSASLDRRPDAGEAEIPK